MTHYVHVHGPDDLFPFATREEAMEFANATNKQSIAYLEQHRGDPLAPTFIAIVHEAQLSRTCPMCPACRG